MRRAPAWAGVLALIAFSLTMAARPQPAPTAGDRLDTVAAELRCPVCRWLSVQDSDSSTARDIRADIKRRITEGETDEQIRAAYVARYGEWVLLRPGRNGVAAAVWLIPPLAAGVGVGVVTVALWRWHRWSGRRANADDRQLVAEARGGTGTDRE